jgi:ATP adenylyltransferase
MSQRHYIDIAAYLDGIQHNPCFICELVTGNPDYQHRVIYEDETAIAFLNKYPTLYGYTLVAPRDHREHVTGDFTPDEYLALQQLIYCVAETLRQEVPTERIYILSLGSQQGNRHVHWHVAPLPPGVSLEKQQFEALTLENGILDISDAEMTALAARFRQRLIDKRGIVFKKD